MSPSSGSGPTISQAMGLLMQALQNETDTFLKILSICSKGGPPWQEVCEVVERVYAAQENAPRPGATPAEPPPFPGDAGPGKDE